MKKIEIKGSKLTKIIKNKSMKTKTKKERICQSLINDGFEESFCDIINKLSQTNIVSLSKILSKLEKSGDDNPDFYIYEMCLYNKHIPSELILYEVDLYNAIRYEKDFIKNEVLTNSEIMNILSNNPEEYQDMQKEHLNLLKNKFKNVPESRLSQIVDKSFELVDLELIPNNTSTKLLVDSKMYETSLDNFIKAILDSFNPEELDRINEEYVKIDDIIISIFPKIEINKKYWENINQTVRDTSKESLKKTIKLMCDNDPNIKSFLEKDDLIYNNKKIKKIINEFKNKKEGVINKMKNNKTVTKEEKVTEEINKCVKEIDNTTKILVPNKDQNLSIIYTKIKDEIFDEMNPSNIESQNIYELLLYYYNKSLKTKELLSKIVHKLKNKYTNEQIISRFILVNKLNRIPSDRYFNNNSFELLLETFN